MNIEAKGCSGPRRSELKDSGKKKKLFSRLCGLGFGRLRDTHTHAHTHTHTHTVGVLTRFVYLWSSRRCRVVQCAFLMYLHSAASVLKEQFTHIMKIQSLSALADGKSGEVSQSPFKSGGGLDGVGVIRATVMFF